MSPPNEKPPRLATKAAKTESDDASSLPQRGALAQARMTRRVALLKIGIRLLSLPSFAFWRFASLRARLETALENERAAR